MVRAPFTPLQVSNINLHQKDGSGHPFTCGSPNHIKECLRKVQGEGILVHSPDNEGVLTATPEGLVCPCGQYRQFWVHEMMTVGKIKLLTEPRMKVVHINL